MTAQPGGRLPAPPHLAPLQDLLNTVNLESGEDALAPGGFAAWTSARGVSGASAQDADRLRLLREHLRDWVAGGEPRVPDPVAAGIDEARLVVGTVDGRVVTTSATVVGRLLAPSVDGIRAAQRDGDWKRLKVCRKETCRWAFYDHSRNNSSRWCASSICGAREKSRRAYRRRTVSPGAGGRPPA